MGVSCVLRVCCTVCPWCVATREKRGSRIYTKGCDYILSESDGDGDDGSISVILSVSLHRSVATWLCASRHNSGSGIRGDRVVRGLLCRLCVLYMYIIETRMYQYHCVDCMRGSPQPGRALLLLESSKTKFEKTTPETESLRDTNTNTKHHTKFRPHPVKISTSRRRQQLCSLSTL